MVSVGPLHGLAGGQPSSGHGKNGMLVGRRWVSSEEGVFIGDAVGESSHCQGVEFWPSGKISEETTRVPLDTSTNCARVLNLRPWWRLYPIGGGVLKRMGSPLE